MAISTKFTGVKHGNNTGDILLQHVQYVWMRILFNANVCAELYSCTKYILLRKMDCITVIKIFFNHYLDQEPSPYKHERTLKKLTLYSAIDMHKTKSVFCPLSCPIQQVKWLWVFWVEGLNTKDCTVVERLARGSKHSMSEIIRARLNTPINIYINQDNIAVNKFNW